MYLKHLIPRTPEEISKKEVTIPTRCRPEITRLVLAVSSFLGIIVIISCLQRLAGGPGVRGLQPTELDAGKPVTADGAYQ